MPELIYLFVALILWFVFAKVIASFVAESNADHRLSPLDLSMAGLIGFAAALVWPVTFVVGLVALFLGVSFKGRLR